MKLLYDYAVPSAITMFSCCYCRHSCSTVDSSTRFTRWRSRNNTKIQYENSSMTPSRPLDKTRLVNASALVGHTFLLLPLAGSQGSTSSSYPTIQPAHPSVVIARRCRWALPQRAPLPSGYWRHSHLLAFRAEDLRCVDLELRLGLPAQDLPSRARRRGHGRIRYQDGLMATCKAGLLRVIAQSLLAVMAGKCPSTCHWDCKVMCVFCLPAPSPQTTLRHYVPTDVHIVCPQYSRLEGSYSSSCNAR